MKKVLLALMAALVLGGPGMALLGVAVVMNPAAKGTCLTDAGLILGPIPDTLEVESTDGEHLTLDAAQLGHAATIITTGTRTSGVGRDGMVIALMAAITESRLKMLTNITAYPDSANWPNDGDGADHDSLGLFQMRHETGWGSVEDLMNPTYQARAFLGGPTGPNDAHPPGLLDIPAWQALDKGAAAQAVEVSAYPDRYATWQDAAETILAALTTPGAPSSSGTVPQSGTVTFPLPAGSWVKTSGFGYRVHPISHVRKLHAGTDYSAPDGTAILAAADGKVTHAGPASGYGNLILITHTIDGQTISSAYGHMWDGHLYVQPGDSVPAGQHIADVGSNGYSTGPHLHFEIRLGGPAGTPIDSDTWLGDHAAGNLDAPTTDQSGCYLEGTP
jgi:hypothetical protein